MRHAQRSRNSFRAYNSLRRVVLLASILLLPACSTLGLSKKGGEQPSLTGDKLEDVKWSFADADKLQTEIAQLKAENARLETEVRSLRRGKAQAEEAALALAANNLPVIAEAEVPTVPLATEKPVTNTAVVAAADADRALADAPPPVEESPRLVQPSFSEEETVFENEASNGEIRLSSVLFGVHLASYKTMNKARSGWQELQRKFPDELGLLEPRVEEVSIPERGVFLRLIGGGFSSQAKATSLCERLKSKGRYCAIAGFDGQRLSLADTSGSGT